MKFRTGKEPRSSRVTSINSIMKNMALAFGLEKKFTLEALRDSWPSIAGAVSSASWPEKIENGIVYISTGHSAVANEIIMLKHAIMSRCEEVFGEKLKDIRTITSRQKRRPA